MRYVVIAMLVASTRFDLNAAQAGTTEERESLRGIKGIGVLIEGITPDARADGLSESEIRTAVELIFRSSGIPLLSEAKSSKPFLAPYLYVNVKALTTKLGLSHYCVEVQFRQYVSPVNRTEKSFPIHATTWQMSMVGGVGADNLRSIISVSVEPLVKNFANDFLALNPR